MLLLAIKDDISPEGYYWPLRIILALKVIIGRKVIIENESAK